MLGIAPLEVAANATPPPNNMAKTTHKGLEIFAIEGAVNIRREVLQLRIRGVKHKICRAKILIMDEPTANLDYGNQFRVMQRVAGLAKNGYTIILSTHNPDHAFIYANRVVMMYGGKVIADGAPDEVLDAELIKKVYGVDVMVNNFENTCRTHKLCVPKDTEF